MISVDALREAQITSSLRRADHNYLQQVQVIDRDEERKGTN